MHVNILHDEHVPIGGGPGWGMGGGWAMKRCGMMTQLSPSDDANMRPRSPGGLIIIYLPCLLLKLLHDHISAFRKTKKR